MDGLYDLLATSKPALLFAVIGLGYFVGNIKVAGFSLGIAGVLFVGLVFGAVDPRAFVIPEEIYVLGLTLFVYTVGLQSGPVFFNLFRRQWLRITLLAFGAILAAALGTLVTCKLLGIDSGVASGLFCGSLTNTPALAAAVETLRSMLHGSTLDPSQVRLRLDGPTVGYSIAYPFGVAGLILVMQVATRLGRVNFLAEERKRASEGQELLTREMQVMNPQIVGKTFGDSMLTDLTGMVFTRIQRGERVVVVAPEEVLEKGNILVGVGTPEAVQKAELLVGPVVEGAVERMSPDIDYRDLVVNNRKVVGVAVNRLGAVVQHPVVVSRIRRGGVHITPLPEETLELGDQVRVVAPRSELEALTQLIGNPLKDISETDFLSFSLGLILGVAIGMVPIPLFGDRVVRLGFAGGPLVVALVLGRLGRTGPIVWTMPANVNLTLRQIGILFFLAGVGTMAGGSFVHTFMTRGIELLLVGALVTLISALVTILIAHKLLGYDMISTYGLIAGIHTQPAALSFASTHTGSDQPNVSYAAVYPVALIGKIILAQILVGF